MLIVYLVILPVNLCILNVWGFINVCFLAIYSIRSASVLIFSPEARLMLSKSNFACFYDCWLSMFFFWNSRQIACQFFLIFSSNCEHHFLQGLLRLFVSWRSVFESQSYDMVNQLFLVLLSIPYLLL